MAPVFLVTNHEKSVHRMTVFPALQVVPLSHRPSSGASVGFLYQHKHHVVGEDRIEGGLRNTVARIRSRIRIKNNEYRLNRRQTA